MKARILIVSLILCLLCGCGKQASQTSTTTTAPNPEVSIPTPVKDPVLDLLNAMTEEELVGQLFLVRYPGTEAALAAVENYHIGGFVLFGVDTQNQTPEGLLAEMQYLQDSSPVPLLIAVDEEGGTVTRVSGYSQYRDSRFPSPRNLYEEGGLELVLQTEKEKCQLLLSLGINVNLAPVCDVTTDPYAFMYKRSLGASPDDTGTYVASVVGLMDSAGVGAVLKHFPGYGNNDDTHIGTAVDNRPLSQLEENDLVPFQMGIDAGCSAIMVSHTTVACLDPNMPASLSPLVMEYMRDEMDFEGVIMTDDLAMQAITDVYGVGEAAVLAVEAGVDVLCCSDYEVQYNAVLQAVKDGRIPINRLMRSVLRVVQWKRSIGLFNEIEQKS